MEPFNQDLLQGAFCHLENLKLILTRLQLKHSIDRVTVNDIYDSLHECQFIELNIKSYDNHNFRLLCNSINSSFSDPNSHGVKVFITKKKFGKNFDAGKLSTLNFEV